LRPDGCFPWFQLAAATAHLIALRQTNLGRVWEGFIVRICAGGVPDDGHKIGWADWIYTIGSLPHPSFLFGCPEEMAAK
jgi:hypothetical protein